MEQIRWYDKNPKLKEVFEFIENLDFESQKNIAQDILQILITDFELNLDEQINTIAKNYTYQCKRWYDQHIDLFTSFEIIKSLSIDMQDKVIKQIIETALFVHLEGEPYG